MGGFLFGVAVLATVLSACASTQRNDLALNDRLYRTCGYQAKVPVQRAAFVAPLTDARTPAAIDASQGPTMMMPESYWARPAPVMLDELLRDELERSKVFTQLVDTAKANVCLVKPSLVRFHGAIVEEAAFRWTYGEAAIRLQVYGPVTTGEERELLLDQVFEHREEGRAQMAPPSPTILLGMAMRQVMGKALASVDQNNVAREGLGKSR